MKRINRSARARPARTELGKVPSAFEERVLTLASIGPRGDAASIAEDGVLYAPLGLPGERVRARVSGGRAEISEVLEPSSERQPAHCRHFGRCGGCQLQHWKETPYLAWKREQVIQALHKRGLGAALVEPIVHAWGDGRRRAAVHASRLGGRVRVGFIERGGAHLAPIEECPALDPRLAQVVLRLGPLAECVLPQRGEITLQCLLTDTGVDVSVKGAGRAAALTAEKIESLVEKSRQLNLARLALDGEVLVEFTRPSVRMGRTMVSPPPGAFLQPTAFGEQVLARLALDALDGAGRVVDLFSGVGTFALRAAESAQVLAVEADSEMLNALKGAADGAGGALKPVVTLKRDLLRTPLSSLEMKKFDGAVIDPPRSGARLQTEQIACSAIRRLAYVSCDAASFARDVKILVEHGFSLSRVTPVDQFRWSPHVEIVGALER